LRVLLSIAFLVVKHSYNYTYRGFQRKAIRLGIADHFRALTSAARCPSCIRLNAPFVDNLPERQKKLRMSRKKAATATEIGT
jgi:hypothetical protein